MPSNEQINYIDIETKDDVDSYFDEYRGSGIADILKKQIDKQVSISIDLAFSSLGNFLELLIEHHRSKHPSSEIKDHYLYNEIRVLIETLIKNPEYNEYKDYLQTKTDALAETINRHKA